MRRAIGQADGQLVAGARDLGRALQDMGEDLLPERPCHLFLRIKLLVIGIVGGGEKSVKIGWLKIPQHQPVGG
jgi:hypothetical protein